MMNTPVDVKIVNEQIEKSGLKDLGKATIREIVGLDPFVRICNHWCSKHDFFDYNMILMGKNHKYLCTYAFD